MTPDLYLAMCATRSAALKAFDAWLQTQPMEHVVTDELMATQAAFRSVHDLRTGRVVIDGDLS